MKNQLVATANAWRESYNPLRSLTIQRAIGLLEGAQRGELADLQWTYEFVEQTDSDLCAIVERTVAAIVEMNWDIKTVSESAVGFDSGLAERQAQRLRLAYERIDNVSAAIEHFGMACLRGFSHAQPHREEQEIVHIECLDWWNFARVGRAGAWVWNPSAQNVSGAFLPAGNVLKPTDLMTLEVRRPIDRLGLVKFIRANTAEKDWDGYVEIYGLPSWIIVGPPNVPADKESQFRDAAETIAAGGGGYLPNGADAKSASSQTGDAPFNPRLEYLTEKLVLAATGGLLTMLTESGSGTLAGSAHMEAFRMIARLRAARISEMFQRTIDREVLAREFPDAPRLAYFEISGKETQTRQAVIDEIVKLASAYDLDPDEVAEKTGYRILGAKQSSEFQVPSSSPRLRASAKNQSASGLLLAAATGDRAGATEAVADRVDARLQTAAQDALAKAMASDLAPVRARLTAAMEIQDDTAMKAALKELSGELPQILEAILKAPASQTVLEDSLAAALLNGIAEGASTRAEETP